MTWDGVHRVLLADLGPSDDDLIQAQVRLTERLAAEQRASEGREAELRVLGVALERRDGETKGHTDRVAALATQLAEALCWSPSQIRAMRWGAYLHDIGKIAIPDTVLLKPGRLTAHEWAVMRSHVEEGMQIVAPHWANCRKSRCRWSVITTSAGTGRATRRARRAMRSAWRDDCSRCATCTTP